MVPWRTVNVGIAGSSRSLKLTTPEIPALTLGPAYPEGAWEEDGGYLCLSLQMLKSDPQELVLKSVCVLQDLCCTEGLPSELR